MYNFTVLDAHCDTMSEMYGSTDLYKSNGQVDIQRMRKYRGWVQFFAIFIDPSIYKGSVNRRFTQIIKKYKQEHEKHKKYIEKVTNYSEICDALSRGKIASMLTLEGGEIIGDDIENVNMLYNLGIRVMTLTWNHTNLLASGSGDESPRFGLTELGKKVVTRANQMGMIIDISHLSDASITDMADISRIPYIASHSNSRSVCNHKRNLTDEQFLDLKINGGVCGINLYSNFLNETGNANLGDVIKHIEHFCSLGGEDNIGLGADFDGVNKTPDELKGVEDVYKIFEELLRLNYSEELVNKIAAENFLRVIKNIL